jgi:hypothetical protein
MTGPIDEILTATEAARILGLDESTVKKACQSGRFLPDEFGKKGRDWWVTRAGMERLWPKKKIK